MIPSFVPAVLWFTGISYHKNPPMAQSGDELYSAGDELQKSERREQNFRGEGAVLGVAADIAIQPLHNGVNTHEAKAMAFALGGEEAFPYFLAVAVAKALRIFHQDIRSF